MDEKRRGEIKRIVAEFRDKKVNNNVIKSWCDRNKIEPITMSQLADYTAQVDHDEIVVKLFGEILTELQKLQYKPEFESEKRRKEIDAANDEVRVNLAKLFEKHRIQYRYVSALSEELGRQIGTKIEMAGTTVFNKALEVMLHIAREKFGGEFTVGDAADYAEEVFEKHDKEKKDALKETHAELDSKAEEAPQAEPEPEAKGEEKPEELDKEKEA